MAISPPSDIVLDVARAAEPATLETRARQAGEPRVRRGRHGRGVLGRRPQEFSARDANKSTDETSPKSYVDFEAMVLQTFVQTMLPKEAEDVYGKGMAGDMWKSMMSQQLGTVMAERGGIGIADSLLKGHYLEGETKVALERRFGRSGKGSARPGAEPVDGAGPGNAEAADIGHRGSRRRRR